MTDKFKGITTSALNHVPADAYEAFDAVVNSLIQDNISDLIPDVSTELFTGKAITEVEAPNRRPDRHMAAVNPIERSQKFDAPNSQFQSNLQQAPPRRGDSRDRSEPDSIARQKIIDKTAEQIRARTPVQDGRGTLSGNLTKKDEVGEYLLPPRAFDPLSDDEAEYYPIFSGLGQ